MSTTFLLHEDIPYAFIDLLGRRGFSAHHLKKIGKQGIRNGEVYGIAARENMWIITRDADFLSMRL
jgi:predicted nuclease of predicted toxin-antitoxin system